MFVKHKKSQMVLDSKFLVNFLFEVHENNSSFLKFLISAFGKFTLRLFRFEHSGPNYKIPFCIFILFI